MYAFGDRRERPTAVASDPQVPELKDDPTPEERAAYVLLRLEQFIREGKTVDEGMSLRKWQAMAQTEIANTIAEAEGNVQKDDPITKRLLFTAGAALITIGFWGTAVSLHSVGYLVGGLICAAAGLALLVVSAEWRLRKSYRRREARKRRERLARIENLNRRIKRLEYELEKEAKSLKKDLKALGRG